MKWQWYYLTIILVWGILAGCADKPDDDIVVIIEDASWGDSDSHPTDTIGRRDSTIKDRGFPTDRRTVSLNGAVRLLKNDLESGDTKIITRHAEVLLNTVETETKKSTDSERKRTLTLFYMKLSAFKRSVSSFKNRNITPTERISLMQVLDELSSLARRVEGRD